MGYFLNILTQERVFILVVKSETQCIGRPIHLSTACSCHLVQPYLPLFLLLQNLQPHIFPCVCWARILVKRCEKLVTFWWKSELLNVQISILPKKTVFARTSPTFEAQSYVFSRYCPSCFARFFVPSFFCLFWTSCSFHTNGLFWYQQRWPVSLFRLGQGWYLLNELQNSFKMRQHLWNIQSPLTGWA